MAKILKKILFLIPFLIISFNIKNVYAEEYNIYQKFTNNSTPFSILKEPEENVNYDYKFTFNYLNNDFKYSVNSGSRVYYNSFVLYDKVNDFYIFNNFMLTSKNLNIDTITDFSINFVCSSRNNFTFYRHNSDSTSWVSFGQSNYSFVLSSKSITADDFYTIMKYSANNSLIYGSFDYNLYYNSSAINSSNFRYYCSNPNNYELVYVYKDNVYNNGNLMEIYTPPTPEPEEPEEPTLPPYNFNNNKYYVPNYQEGNCVEVIDKDTIRVFENEFSLNYVDYYINSNYISKTGQVEVDYQKNCSTLQFTNIRYYGNDFPQILFILVCILTFTIGFPYILYKRFRKR